MPPSLNPILLVGKCGDNVTFYELLMYLVTLIVNHKKITPAVQSYDVIL